MEREVGGGIRMGNTGKSMAESFQCMTKPTTIKKRKKKNCIGHVDSQFVPVLANFCIFLMLFPISLEPEFVPWPLGFFSLSLSMYFTC